MNGGRYIRQMTLPQITPTHQEKLTRSKILMIGAGGLGAAALPLLAGAGVGHIAIIDGDSVEISNLHRQTIYRTEDAGQPKAAAAARYLTALNPEIKIAAHAEYLNEDNAAALCGGYDLILDGSDNFETRALVNRAAIAAQTVLISAAVDGFSGMAAVFAGHDKAAPCYRCLHPEFPDDACNCADSGILGSVAALGGNYMAHLALLYLLDIGDIRPGHVLHFDFMNFRTTRFNLPKDPACLYCAGHAAATKKEPPMNAPAIPLKPRAELPAGCAIIDVRTDDEVAADPIAGALHIPIDQIVARYDELPAHAALAFACASNIRSRKAAEYVHARGRADVYVMDRIKR